MIHCTHVELERVVVPTTFNIDVALNVGLRSTYFSRVPDYLNNLG